MYPWGNEAPECTRLNNGGCVGDTSAVGAYAAGASPYGVMDMAGNAYEWVNDWFGGGYYAISPAADPQGPTTGTARVMRDGSWQFYGGFYVRTALRGSNSGEPNNGLGFRCARTP